VRALLAACAFVSGCIAVQQTEAPLGPGEIRSARAALQTLVIGKSTKADVRDALGEATVIDFESGYEVWVYRERLRDKAPPPAPELVLLFAPSGVLAKARVR
jgi:hypothetical protein